MKGAKMSNYAPTVSQLITETDKTGEKLSKYYEPLKKALDKDDLSKINLAETKEKFQNGTTFYKETLRKLKVLGVPARIIGKHKLLVGAYSDYADACQEMVDSINPDDNTVDKGAFKDSEDAQSDSVARVIKYTQKILVG
ncbi:hypothetical protein [Lactobacillus sp. Sy-1]|uniref:hypothetical protein n=1 Tax=Lactobacillus sp. Sy-1 TaxID=2109645 RepID=UPI001C5A7603|nr:hypothetical protein [Lactobacillus sp. Sy-1]MBW1606018.1 hypothetical protein [Lactobacillus sp. Sy-1]